MIKKEVVQGKKAYIIIITKFCLEEMIMQEKLVIVPKKKQQVDIRQGMIAFFVLTCLCLVLSMFVSPVMFLVPTIIFGVIWYLFAFRSEVEYEYTYYDGDLRFAKIRNKAKRKKKLPILVWMMCDHCPEG